MTGKHRPPQYERWDSGSAPLSPRPAEIAGPSGRDPIPQASRRSRDERDGHSATGCHARTTTGALGSTGGYLGDDPPTWPSAATWTASSPAIPACGRRQAASPVADYGGSQPDARRGRPRDLPAASGVCPARPPDPSHRRDQELGRPGSRSPRPAAPDRALTLPPLPRVAGCARVQLAHHRPPCGPRAVGDHRPLTGWQPADARRADHRPPGRPGLRLAPGGGHRPGPLQAHQRHVGPCAGRRGAGPPHPGAARGPKPALPRRPCARGRGRAPGEATSSC